jgi:hypothetical protein
MEFDFPGIGKAFPAPAAVAAVVSWIFPALAKGNVDNYFNQKLEQFRHDLGKLAASAQFEHQRKLRELQAFRGKRHEAYAGVYEGARLVPRPGGVRRGPPSEDGMFGVRAPRQALAGG